MRFTLGLAAGTEVLDRVFELNHARYAADVRGLHRPKKGGKRGARKEKHTDAQAGLFESRSIAGMKLAQRRRGAEKGRGTQAGLFAGRPERSASDRLGGFRGASGRKD